MEDCQFPTPKKIPSVQTKSQKNAADFFYIRGIVHYECVPTGQTDNQVYYLEVLERLLDKVRWKQPELFANNRTMINYKILGKARVSTQRCNKGHTFLPPNT
jgi:hypothetical protein